MRKSFWNRWGTMLLSVVVIMFGSPLPQVFAEERSTFQPGVSAGLLRLEQQNLFLTTVDLTLSNYHSTSGGSQSWGPASFSSFWVSAGAKYAHGTEQLQAGYFEAGSWFLFAFGGGITVQRYHGGSETGFHGFIGLPIPIGELFDLDESLLAKIYLEPYYRYTNYTMFNTHEFGLYIKTAYAAD